MTLAQVQFPEGDLWDVEILGTDPYKGVKVRPLNAVPTVDNPEPHCYVPPSWLVGYRPADHPEWNHSVRPAQNPQRLTDNQRAVLGALVAAGDLGMVDDDHELVNGLRADSAGKRRLELLHMGYVEATKKRRKTRRGAYAIVWSRTSAAHSALIAHDNALIAV